MKKIVGIRATGEGADLFASHLFVYEISYDNGTKSDIIADIETINVIGGLAGVKVVSILEQEAAKGDDTGVE